MKEAIHIQAHQPELNKDRSHFQLPHIYLQEIMAGAPAESFRF